MAYLRQQRALFAVVGVGAAAALFVDTKARSGRSERVFAASKKAAWPPRGARRRRACPRVCAGAPLSGVRRPAERLSARERALTRLRPQRAVLRSAADTADGWVSPPPASKPLPVRGPARSAARAAAAKRR